MDYGDRFFHSRKGDGVADTPENRSKIIISYIKDLFEEKMPGVISRGIIPKDILPSRDPFNDLFSGEVEWFQKTMEDVKTYLENEEKVLRKAILLLESTGVTWDSLTEDFNGYSKVCLVAPSS